MIFSALLADQVQASAWIRLMQNHAGWLNTKCELRCCTVDDGRILSFGWLGPPAAIRNPSLHQSTDELFLTTTGGCVQSQNYPWNKPFSESESNLTSLAVNLRTAEIRVRVPPANPEQFYFTDDRRGLLMSNDLRLMLRWSPLNLDPLGVYQLLQYSSISAPVTISTTVSRVENGHIFISSPRQSPVTKPYFHIAPPSSCSNFPTRDIESLITGRLDEQLEHVPQGSIVYFSGGLDSGLIVARSKAIGRDDLRLVNLSYGAGDGEAQHARRMAAVFGLEFEQLDYRLDDALSVVDRLGRDYSYPFGDCGAIAWNQMTHRSAVHLHPGLVVLGGEGGDESFGSAAKYAAYWNAVYSLPRPARAVVSYAFKLAGVWKYGPPVNPPAGQQATVQTKKPAPGLTNSTYRLLGKPGMMRRSISMPQHSAAMAYNALDGIAYRMPRLVRQEVESMMLTRAQSMAGDLDSADLYAFKLLLSMAENHSSKSFDLLRAHGVRYIAPFLNPRMLKTTFSVAIADKVDGADLRALEKRLLARSVPAEFVYREKIDPPFESTFVNFLATSKVQDFLHDVVLSSNNPVMDFVRPRIVRAMVKRARLRLPLTAGANNFLWMVTFLSGWLQQIHSAI